MNFRATFCDPFKADVIEIGDIEKEKVIELFEKTPWAEYLTKMDERRKEVYQAPSLGFENINNRNIINISIDDANEWLIFYIRPKLVKRLFGLLGEKMNNNYMTEIQGQTESDVRSCLEALIRNDLEFLENKIK